MRRALSSALRTSYREGLHRLLRTLVPEGSRVLHVGCGDGSLLAALRPAVAVGVDADGAAVARARTLHPELTFLHLETSYDAIGGLGVFDHVVLGDVLARLPDLWAFLRDVRPLVAADGLLVLTYYNFLWEPVVGAAERLRLKDPAAGHNWLPVADMVNLLELAGYEPVRSGHANPLPVGPRRLASAVNAALSDVPGVRRLGITSYATARHMRPVPPAGAAAAATTPAPTCSVVIPARNERGNIRPAIARLPAMGSHLEVVFVEGHSRDGTADEIRAVIREHPEVDIKLVEQGDGRGKGHAMRKGFAAAAGDVLLILDADLTVPPEDLPKFWAALAEGKGDFVNGTRMVYPMEKQAMRMANLAANKAFGMIFSWILAQHVTDTLCGTKALWAADYRRIGDNRHVFGDFDPFGDFDLLFGAAHLGLRIREVPIRYRARTYGTTQISRWRHGVLLLGMAIRGARMLRLTPGMLPRSGRTAAAPRPSSPAGSPQTPERETATPPARR
ncbi:MAG TPA: glycosyltransferase [Candidatus Dormibacteraeota bacterium]|nr:glycosyltransferase [Candidatus Dormibacteraeota bacterium]